MTSSEVQTAEVPSAGEPVPEQGFYCLDTPALAQRLISGLKSGYRLTLDERIAARVVGEAVLLLRAKGRDPYLEVSAEGRVSIVVP